MWDRKFIFAVVDYEIVSGSAKIWHEFMRQICKYKAWVHFWLKLGLWPTEDYYNSPWPQNSVCAKFAGQPLTDSGYSALYLGTKGDCKARVQSHFFCYHYNCNYVCDQCCATTYRKTSAKHLRFCDSRPAAEHKKTKVTTAEYFKSTPVDQLSPYAQIEGFSLGFNLFDILHCGFLGTWRITCATAITRWLQFGYLGPNNNDDCRNETLARVSEEFADWRRHYGLKGKCPRLTVASIGFSTKAEYPELSSLFKAVAVKYLMQFLAHKTIHIEKKIQKDRDLTHVEKTQSLLLRCQARFVSVLEKNKGCAHRG